MSSIALRSAALFALLTAAAAAPTRALSLGAVPAQPVEGTPFTLGIGLVADCVGVDGVVVTPGFPGRVTVTLNGSCPLIPPPPRPLLLEVPIGPLPAGRWIVRVELSGSADVTVIGALAADVMAEAILRAVRSASARPGYPSVSALREGAR